MSQNRIQLHDRVKELTYTEGLGNFALARTADGFSQLQRFYSHQDVFFYAATDGVRYEIGSGVLLRADYSEVDAITYNEVVRHPFRSSNTDNSKIDFPPGVKEVFITYPATHAVMMGSGIPGCNVPERKGVAVWDSENVLNYFADITYDSSMKSFGVNQPNHFYGVDVGGDGVSYSSRVRASGYFVGATGIYYNEGNAANASIGLTETPYQGGTQYVHFSPNVINTDTNAHLVIEASGDVNQNLLLKKQTAHTVFAGPIDDCDPSCEENYPLFRTLVVDDLPMSELSANHFLGESALIALSGNLTSYTDSGVFVASGFLQSGIDIVSGNLDTHISNSATEFRDLELALSGKVDTFLHNVEHENPYCTVRGDSTDGYNAGWTNDNQTSNYVIFPFSHVESESTTGDWDTTNYWYTFPRSGNYSVTADIAASYVSGDGDVDNYFRLCTSGDGTVTEYLSTAIFMGDPDDGNGSSSWTFNVPSGNILYLEYKGQPRNYSKLSIHKI